MKKCIAFFVVFFSLITTASAELILSGGKSQPDGSIIVKGGFPGGFTDNDGGELFFRTNILDLDPNSNNVSLLRNNDVAYSTTGIHDGNLFKSITSQIDVGDIYSEVFPVGGILRMWFNIITSTGGIGCSIPFCPGDIFAQFSLSGGDVFASLFNNGQRTWEVQISEKSFAVPSPGTLILMLTGMILFLFINRNRRFYFSRSDYGGTSY